MARRGFTPGRGPARSSQDQRPELNACVVYYQHPPHWKSVIFAFGATKALCLSFMTGPCDWTQVSRIQAFYTENCRAADHAGSGPGLDPVLDPAARFGGRHSSIRRLQQAGRVPVRGQVHGRDRGPVHGPLTARAPILRRRPSIRHATDTVSPGHLLPAPYARNPAWPAP